MSISKRVLMIAVLVGLLGLASSAVAQEDPALELDFNFVPGAPTGYRSFDIIAQTTTNLGAIEILLEMNDPASIYQVGSTDPTVKGATYDTYLNMPVSFQTYGAALDIDDTPRSLTWGDQTLDVAWGPQGGQQSGPGPSFQLGRITLANWASGSYTIMGWQGNQVDATVITGDFTPTQVALSTLITPDTVTGYKTIDFFANVSPDLQAIELVLNADTAGDIRNLSPGTPDDGTDAFDSYVTVGIDNVGSTGENPADTNVLPGGAVDIPSSSGGQLWTTQDLDVTWLPGNTVATGEGLFHVARVTLKNDAKGSYTLKGWQGDDIIPDTIVGEFGLFGDVDGDGDVDATDLSIITTNWGQTDVGRALGDLDNSGTVDGADYSEVLSYWAPPEPPTGAVPEPATLGLLLLGGLLALRRRSK